MFEVHIIGAGLAGLATAVRLAENGVRTTLYEAAGHAGGRCRSFHDHTIDRQIDNGNHLVLSGNTAISKYVGRIGARPRLREIDPARFPFIDLKDGLHWTLEPGRWPWWVLQDHRMPPDVSAAALIRDLLALARATSNPTVGDCLDTESASYQRLWAPLTVAALNTEAATATANGLWAVVRETLLKGERASRPMLAREGLSAALIDPALSWLAGNDSSIRFGARLRALECHGNRVARLLFSDEAIELNGQDKIILATPPNVACELLPELTPPVSFSAILNAHFVAPRNVVLPANTPFMGVLNGTAEWIFQRDDVISVTVSSANRFADDSNDELATMIWRDVATVLRQPGAPLPPYRIIVEKRATVAQTPAWELCRPDPTTSYGNLILAGDWTRTGVPATLEGAVRSGFSAADIALAQR